MNQKILYLAIIALFGSISSLKAQLFPNLGGQRAGVSALTFLKNDVSTRSMGMGGASIALESNGYGLYNNPASIADHEQFTLSTSNLFMGAGLNQSYLGAVLPTNNLSAWGLSLNTLTTNAMEVRTEFQPDGTGELFYAGNYALGLSYAKILSDNFSMGLTFKYIYEQLAQYKNHTVAVDLGFRYNTDYKQLKFAVLVQNFGGNSSLSGDFLANTYNRSSSLSLDKYSLPTTFMLGMSLVPYERKNQSLLLALQLNHPNDNAENIRIGLEYEYMKLLFVRLGYKINVLGQSFPSMGFGLRSRIGKNPLVINYAMLPTNYFGLNHSFGFVFSFNKTKQAGSNE